MVLVHTQKIEAQSEKPTWTKALEFTQFACPCGTDPRLLSGEQRTSHFKLVTSVDDPERTSSLIGFRDQQLTQAGATEAFQIVLPVRVVLDRYLVRDPSKRNIGLHAAKLLERGHGGLNLAGHAGGGGEDTVSGGLHQR